MQTHPPQRHKDTKAHKEKSNFWFVIAQKGSKGSFMNNSLWRIPQPTGRSRYPPARDRAGLAERLEGEHPRWRTTARGREA